MKIVFLVLMVSLSVTSAAGAENWQKIMDCENESVVLDVNANERRTLQLVLRGDNLLGNLFRAGMVGLNYGQQEVVIRGVHADLRQATPTATQPYSLGGVFYPRDFKNMISFTSGSSLYEVEVRGSQLVLKRLTVREGSSCTKEIGLECLESTFHSTYSFEKEYVLRGCHRY